MVLLVCNPPSLKLLSVYRIRQSISCMEEDVERNLIEKLNAGDLDDLRNPNVPISLEDMCKSLHYLENNLQYLANIFVSTVLTDPLT